MITDNDVNLRLSVVVIVALSLMTKYIGIEIYIDSQMHTYLKCIMIGNNSLEIVHN